MPSTSVDVDGPAPGSADGAIRFSALDDGPGLRVVDRIERRQYPLATPTTVAPEPVDPADVPAPVDAAARVRTSAVTLPKRESVYVRDEAGDPVAHVYDAPDSLPAGRYLIEVTTAVKLYLRVEAPVAVRPSPDATTIDFDGPTDLVVGARSPHRRPGGTVTTTADLDDLRAAVSTLGSALKTTSPERSYPTLRGHPPRIELGDALSVPPSIQRPDSGVTLEVGRSLEDLLVAAPLAFYLGADVGWGDRQLRTDAGYVTTLTAGGDLQTGVERTLKQTFLMDCLTRTEGYYPVDLEERRRFEDRTPEPIDFEDLYVQPLGRRLETYLAVPYRTVADLVPAWAAETYVEPAAESVTALPYLVDTLSTIRTSGPRWLEDSPAASQSVPADGATRSAESASPPAEPRHHLRLPEPDSALTTAWVGEGVPLGASKVLEAGFEHRLEREPTAGDIRLQVVCNAPEMRDERDSVHEVYHARGDLPYDVDVRTDRSTDELREALERDADLFHFIGHVDRQGFRCSDGWLDADTLDDVGADAFLLNSCRSYEQGEALVRNGAVAGIATVADLLNHHAAAIGRTLGVFLNHGFPVYVALEAARDTHRFGDAYALLGDPHAAVSQPTTTGPEYLELRTRSAEGVTVAHRTFLGHWVGLGADACPPYEDGDRHHLLGGELATVSMSPDELEDLLALPMPLRDGDDLRFTLGPAPDAGAADD